MQPAACAERIFCKAPRCIAEEEPALSVYVGACILTLHLPASHSLKDKRQVVRSLSDRLRRQFNVAVAEVEEQDAWQTAVLGLAVISNEAGHASRQVERILEAIEETRLDAELVDRQIDVMSL
ncbi:MAG: DUF503 domain-containing protein [Chloroflexi bacterium]|nr:DUF503 domain-containing protein [Chloroflexota bacterium]